MRAIPCGGLWPPGAAPHARHTLWWLVAACLAWAGVLLITLAVLGAQGGAQFSPKLLLAFAPAMVGLPPAARRAITLSQAALWWEALARAFWPAPRFWLT